MKLINADRIPYANLNPQKNEEAVYIAFKDEIEKIPVVDAIPVIRCKDCKHASDMINDGRCWCTQLNAFMHYCDMGEREEE